MLDKELCEEMIDALIDASGYAWSCGSNKSKRCAEKCRELALKARAKLEEADAD